MVTQYQKHIMEQCQNWCDEQDKSTEFMIHYMCDHLQLQHHNLSYEDAHDLVMEYLIE